MKHHGFSLAETIIAASLLLLVFTGLLVLLPSGRLALVRMGALLAADALASNAMQQELAAVPPLTSYDTSLNGQTFHVDVAVTTPVSTLRLLTVTVSWSDPVGQVVNGNGRLQRRTYQELLCDVPH
ncbi:MAG: hypothetical protein ACYCW6_28350 [Candidatus Xenobia bacterium]